MATPPLRPDCRRFVCDRCRTAVYICSWCDHGHRYCSSHCRQAARRRSLSEAGQRYQQSRRGRRLHAQRQATYRQRLRARSRQKVTHHRCRPTSGSASVTSRERTPERSDLSPVGHGSRCRNASSPIVCRFCGHGCEPFVRDEFLRCRRASPGADMNDLPSRARALKLYGLLAHLDELAEQSWVPPTARMGRERALTPQSRATRAARSARQLQTPGRL